MGEIQAGIQEVHAFCILRNILQDLQFGNAEQLMDIPPDQLGISWQVILTVQVFTAAG